MLGEEELPVKSKVISTAFDGTKSTHVLKQLNLRILSPNVTVNETTEVYMPLLCTIVNNLMEEVLLSMQDYNWLNETFKASHISNGVYESTLTENDEAQKKKDINVVYTT